MTTPQRRPSTSVLALSAGSLLVGLLAMSGLWTEAAPPTAITIPMWGLAVAFALTELAVVHLHFRRSAHSFLLSEVALLLGLFFSRPLDLFVAYTVAPLAVWLLRRMSPLKACFNFCQYALTAAIVSVVFRALDGTPMTPLDPRGALAAAAAAGVAMLVTSLAISLAISLTEDGVERRQLAQMVGIAAVVTVTNTMLGLTAVAVIGAEPWSAALLVVPAATIFVAYRAYLSERQKHESLMFLHDATQTLAGEKDFVIGLSNLLSRTVENFRAERAEVVLLPGTDRDSPRRTSVTLDGSTEAMAQIDANVVAALEGACPEDGTAILVHRTSASPALGAYMGERGIETAMIARLQGESRMLGTMLVADRVGVSGAFGVDDLRLFETLSRQASASLEFDRLEEAFGQLREMQFELEHQAFHDHLTGLANRALFRERVDHALQRRVGHIAVLFVDLDDFKTINDSLGHAAGDQLLILVAERIRTVLRPADTPARLGGDEFAVLLDEIADQDHAALIAGRLLDAVAASYMLNGESVSVRASIGIATSALPSADTSEELLRNADVAMYTAKSRGKGCYETFAPRMHGAVVERYQLKEDLRRAVDQEEFVVHYQPVYDLSTEKVAGVEALVRWNHPVRGMVGPSEFIGLAEETGQIVPIGWMVLAEACRVSHPWRARSTAAGERFLLHVNLSARQLQQPALVDDIAKLMEEHDVAPGDLTLEITETVLMQEPQRSLLRLRELKDLGVRLALDDFGTGYSSLSYLHWFPIDTLKIAKPFVDGLGHRPADSAFARVIIELAHTLDLDVVAEGIETAQQHQVLQDLNCEWGQGYHFCQAVSHEDLSALLGMDAAIARLAAGGAQ